MKLSVRVPKLQVTKKTAVKTLVIVVAATLTISLGIYKAILWGNSNKLIWQSIVKTPLTLQRFYRVEKIKEVADVTVLRTPDDVLLASQFKKKGVFEMAKSTSRPDIAMYILGVFGEDGEEMLATLIAESGLNPEAKGWNCTYPENGQMISRACNPEDRPRAWSVDCGVAQLNFSGTECPKESFDPVWSVDMAFKKFQRQGWGAWVANARGLHEKYMVSKSSN